MCDRPRRQIPRDARTLIVLEDLTDVDNLGAIARHAAAFGADAILLSPRSADPFYRKAIRVSLGSVFTVPIVRLARWPDQLQALRAEGVSLVGAVLDPDAVPLIDFARPARVALMFGAEGPGLSPAARAACDHRVTIPMSPGADSLNVATAAALFLFVLPLRALEFRFDQETKSLRVSGWHCGQKQASPSPTRTARIVVPQTRQGLPSRPRTLRKSRTFTSGGSFRLRISAIASRSTRPIAS